MTAYYNEFDKQAAQWLRNLITAGLIAPGYVDDRDIRDVSPDDLIGYDQCHFFAGVGVWSYALRLAGIPDGAKLWTASCPCQPFSAAGKGSGFDDERHLWPALYWLISQCRPPIIFGEQVASKAAEPWIDLVHADLEEVDYAFGCVPFPAAGVGAPHIRDRTYWVAYSADSGQLGRWPDYAGHGLGAARFELERLRNAHGLGHADMPERAAWHPESIGAIEEPECITQPGLSGFLGDAIRAGLEGHGGYGDDRGKPGRVGAQPGGSATTASAARRVANAGRAGSGGNSRAVLGPEALGSGEWLLDWYLAYKPQPGLSNGGVANADDPQRGADASGGDNGEREDAGRSQGAGDAQGRGDLCGLADANGCTGGQGSALDGWRDQGSHAQSWSGFGGGGVSDVERPGPVNGFWRDADWLFCRDDKWRPVGPGTFPLVTGAPSRVVRLRAYGNAINAAQAAHFISAVIGPHL